jgi:hypothetical protein
MMMVCCFLGEGNSSGGSVSFLGDDMTIFKQDVYGAENPGDFIGKYVQNIFFDGDKAYIIGGGSNVINVVNRYSFSYLQNRFWLFVQVWCCKTASLRYKRQ